MRKLRSLFDDGSFQSVQKKKELEQELSKMEEQIEDEEILIPTEDKEIQTIEMETLENPTPNEVKKPK
jgi:hypothetical protein